MAVAWNHLQIEMIDRLGVDGMALARELAMTTYRSEADFEERFGRSFEPDGRPSIVSYLDYQGRKLIDRFDPATYRTLASAMDRHDIGATWGSLGQAVARLAAGRHAPDRRRHPGRHPVRPASGPGPRQGSARRRGSKPRYREIRSNKGHDAFLVEWDQLTAILREALTA